MNEENTRIEFAKRQGWTNIHGENDEVFQFEVLVGSPPGCNLLRDVELPNITSYSNVHAALMGMSEEEWRQFTSFILKENKLIGADAWASVYHTLKTPLPTLVSCYLEATKGRITK